MSSSLTQHYRVLPSYSGFYWVLPVLSTLEWVASASMGIGQPNMGNRLIFISRSEFRVGSGFFFKLPADFSGFSRRGLVGTVWFTRVNWVVNSRRDGGAPLVGGQSSVKITRLSRENRWKCVDYSPPIGGEFGPRRAAQFRPPSTTRMQLGETTSNPM